MCADVGCDSDGPPPAGESWCPRRIDVEYARWFTGWPGMEAGPDMDLKPSRSNP